MELILAANRAVAEDVGLLATFLGLGVIVNIIVVYLGVQIYGERMQNRRARSRSGRDVDV